MDAVSPASCRHNQKEPLRKQQIEKLKAALRAAPQVAVMGTCDGPAEYSQWYNGLRAEALCERKTGVPTELPCEVCGPEKEGNVRCERCGKWVCRKHLASLDTGGGSDICMDCC